MFVRLSRFSVRTLIAASLLAATDVHAGQPCPVQPVPIYQTPYGYYPTQWRPYPMFGEQPPPLIAIVFPAESPPVPKKIAPESSPMVVPKKMEPKVVEPIPELKKLSSAKPLASPYNQMILPPTYVPGEKAFARGLQPVAILPEDVAPEIKILSPNAADDLLKEAGEEATDAKQPSQPKAWLELPIPVPTPTIRGSSHELGAKPQWVSAPRKRDVNCAKMSDP